MEKTDTTKRTQEKRKGFTKKIGNTTYDVSFHYGRLSRESMNDKIIRLIENDKTTGSGYESPQGRIMIE